MFFDEPLWKEPREYSRAEAWLDLIQSARFESSQEIFNNRVIDVRMSEVVASRRYLEARWGWGSSKVSNFLDYLRKNHLITVRQTSGQTILTICNSAIYKDGQTTERTSDKPATNQRQTSDKPNNKKEKKEKKENISSSTTPTRERDDYANGYRETAVGLRISETPEKSCAKKVPPQMPLQEFGRWLKNNDRWLDAYCINNAYTREFVLQKIDEFVRECENNGETTKDRQDGVRHFNNWVRKRRNYYGIQGNTTGRRANGDISIDEFDRQCRERVAKRLAGTYGTGQ